jgi:hypothetical protein
MLLFQPVVDDKIGSVALAGDSCLIASPNSFSTKFALQRFSKSIKITPSTVPTRKAVKIPQFWLKLTAF